MSVNDDYISLTAIVGIVVIGLIITYEKYVAVKKADFAFLIVRIMLVLKVGAFACVISSSKRINKNKPISTSNLIRS